MRELLEAIKRVCERIKRYENQLRQNEMLTRYALVDPILRALGWDTEDPEQVVPEFQTEGGRRRFDILPNWQNWHGCRSKLTGRQRLLSNLEQRVANGMAIVHGRCLTINSPRHRSDCGLANRGRHPRIVRWLHRRAT
jgi:hypothetical protein